MPTSAAPRWATERSPERKTLGEQAARIASKFGTPLMPWQRQVLDVALEIDPTTGHFAYRDVVVTCPRQQGKSTLLLVLILLWALRRSRQRIAYTAQTGADARSKLERDWLPALKASPFNTHVKAKMANGREALAFSNGSLAALISTTRKSGHGASIDLGILDEAFAHPDARIEQAVKPAMMARPDPQWWITSTAGTPAESPYLLEKVEAGRQAVEAGLRHGFCYFEWSAPDGADPKDSATWRACMPALGYTVTEEAIAADLATMDLAEFRRAYLNQWTTASIEPVIPLATWQALADPRSQALDPVVLAFDVSPSRQWGTIAAAGKRADGKVHVEVCEHREGTNWLAPRLYEIAERQHPSVVVCDGAGPAASLIPELRRLRVEVATTGAADMAHACGVFFDAATSDRLRHLGDPELSAALDGAAKRQLGDAWAWSRRHSGVDITPLVAVTLAAWALDSRRDEPEYANVGYASDYTPADPDVLTHGVGQAQSPKILTPADVTIDRTSPDYWRLHEQGIPDKEIKKLLAA